MMMLPLLLATAIHADSVLNIYQPIKTLKISNEQLRSAIINAAQTQHWQVTAESEGALSARYQKSDYMAKIAIKYAPTYYSINYADSRRMRYDGRTIHPTYNRLIKALQAGIVKNLKAGNFAAQAGSSAPASATGPEDELRRKLLKIKALYEEGLITKDEYDAKRKSIIETY
jgi:hypothetical protein